MALEKLNRQFRTNHKYWCIRVTVCIKFLLSDNEFDAGVGPESYNDETHF
jgi:hypothetical protein